MLRSKDKGFVLIMVLVFLQIFSYTGLQALANESTFNRVSHHQWEKISHLDTAAKFLSEIEANINRVKSVCAVAMESNASLVKRPLSWWKQYACSDNVSGLRYYYIVQPLGREECSVIRADGNNLAVNYYRITLLAFVDSVKGARMMLQSTMANSTGEMASCQDKIRFIRPGRQMQRELKGNI